MAQTVDEATAECPISYNAIYLASNRGLCHRNSRRKTDILNTEKQGNSSV